MLKYRQFTTVDIYNKCLYKFHFLQQTTFDINLHLHVGAFPLQMPFSHLRVTLPMRACPIGHEYDILDPFVKLRPETVVFCSESGEPHDKGSESEVSE